MRAVCEEFARHGYVAVMPNLFTGRGPRPICIARTMIDASRGKVNDDIDAARSWLVQQEEVDGERIGVIGFCMGGGFALAYVAGGRPGVRAVAVNYGEVPRESASLRGACPIVGSYGARDKVLGRSHAERLSRETCVGAGAVCALRVPATKPLALTPAARPRGSRGRIQPQEPAALARSK